MAMKLENLKFRFMYVSMVKCKVLSLIEFSHSLEYMNQKNNSRNEGLEYLKLSVTNEYI